MLTINLFNGLVYGALLIVMCSGLALIYGLRRVVNFAHGSLYMMGAYLGYTIALNTNFWVALVAAAFFEDKALDSDVAAAFCDPRAAAAEEAALSRLYGGIHFRSAIERGLEQGRCIATHVNALKTR